ncbi:PREDICTED: F-box protein CPR30-like [Camelina sativa]|uniref:F-box protein CPR30-like n=1 Tax=Camelina sativa TaxID=90675 RepID=A0ABM1QKS4_CAMSA|nr:PREDICTED: F-box protein CPR30-like [Camelina sativa]
MDLIWYFYFYYHLLYRRGYGVLASNSLHWVMPSRPGLISFNTIIRFDLDSDEFAILDFPESLAHENLDIGVLDGCLCLMCNNHEFSYVDVWVMKEYNVEESWSKLFRVPKPKNVESFDFIRPLLYSKERDKVLLEINNAKLVWFDLASKRCRTLRIKDCDSLYSAELLVSSLVLGCKGDPDEVMRRKERRAREDKIMQERNKRDDFLSKGFKLVL